MIRDTFRVLEVDLASGRGKVLEVEGRNRWAGGSGLAALLFGRNAQAAGDWDDPSRPLIFAIGPLTGYFPLMSKTVCAFTSPVHGQYAESHGGGRSALCLRFADLDALVLKGKAPRLSCLAVGSRRLEVMDVHYLQGRDVASTGKYLRRMIAGDGHRSILRIGPAGENGSAMACINVDSYRHFGRLGAGAVMGAKNLKGIVLLGDGNFPAPGGKTYPSCFREVHRRLTATDMMDKYHNLGTAANVALLNELKALPIRNLQATSDPAVSGITGERFADLTLLRNTACAGCPVGCIHLGFVREKFMEPNQYLYRQVAYDHEPIFAMGSMLGLTDPFRVLSLVEAADREGLDVMSAGVALAWATEALQNGLIGENETRAPLAFGEFRGYLEGIRLLDAGANEFYRCLAGGVRKAAGRYGGSDFACVLGQEMAGYATGEVFFVSQALGLRHSHLDSGGYSIDQSPEKPSIPEAVDFLIRDEAERAFLTSMVACLFARGVYRPELLSECLSSVGYGELAGTLPAVSTGIQRLRWTSRFEGGFDPDRVEIPRRFTEVRTWRGPIDPAYLGDLRKAYGEALRKFSDDPAPVAP